MKRNYKLTAILALSLSALASHTALAQNAKITANPHTGKKVKLPVFADYPLIDDIYKGQSAPVVLKSQADSAFRTRLREASKEPANFAGEYSLTAWGCGAVCLMVAAVHLKTGRVIFAPGSISEWRGDGDAISFQLQSRLFVASGYINGEGKHGKHYYEFTGHRFKHIKTDVLPVKDWD